MAKKGFTLIELLIVIMIASIILTLSAFGIRGAIDNARDQKRMADLQEIRSGLSRFRADCSSYPSDSYFRSISPNQDLVGDPSLSPNCPNTNVYIDGFPGDPDESKNYYYESYPAASTQKTSYILCASLTTPPDPPQDTSACGFCGSSPCNFVVRN